MIMGMPQGTTTENRADERTTGTVPANRNTDDVTGFPAFAKILSETESTISFAQERQVDLWENLVVAQQRQPALRENLALIRAGLAEIDAGLAAMQRNVAGIKSQLAAAAVETSARVPDAKAEITCDAPAIIVRRSIAEAINRGDLRPGQKLPGQDIILVTAWEPTDRAGERLGRKLAGFGAPENLPGAPRTFNQNVAANGNLENWHGYNGWKFDRQRCGTSSYEGGRFKGYQDGSAIGTWGVPELPILNGNDRDGKHVTPAENMLVLSRDEKSAFKNFVISGSGDAKWSQSCTETRGYPVYVHTVHFPDGNVVWDRKGLLRSCVRPVVALELNHLIP
jgi:hypothetical protein